MQVLPIRFLMHILRMNIKRNIYMLDIAKYWSEALL